MLHVVKDTALMEVFATMIQTSVIVHLDWLDLTVIARPVGGRKNHSLLADLLFLVHTVVEYVCLISKFLYKHTYVLLQLALVATLLVIYIYVC